MGTSADSPAVVTEWEDTVGIGGSIFLIALGAILAFAVHASLGFVSIQVVGWVLMAAGAVGLILTLWFWNSRRRPVVDRPVVERPVAERPVVPAQPVAPDDEVVEERRRTVRYNDY
jgi:hypothetical protein